MLGGGDVELAGDGEFDFAAFLVDVEAEQDGAAAGYADLSVIDTFKYQDSMSPADTAAIGGEDPKATLDALAAEWDQLTHSVGADKQRDAYKH